MENKRQILIVEDEEKIARLLEIELTYEGYETTKVYDGYEGFAAIKSQEWDLILLDVMLPGISGIEILRRTRSIPSNVPVILLTAKDAIEDKVAGLDLGANDYVTKPFQMEELLARVRAHLRQRDNGNNHAEQAIDWLQFKEIKVSEETREVFHGEHEVALTPREFDLLVYLMQHIRIVLSRDQLLNRVWGFDYIGDTNVVDVYIRYLRNKLDKPFGTKYIQTVRGVGYVLKDEQ